MVGGRVVISFSFLDSSTSFESRSNEDGYSKYSEFFTHFILIPPRSLPEFFLKPRISYLLIVCILLNTVSILVGFKLKIRCMHQKIARKKSSYIIPIFKYISVSYRYYRRFNLSWGELKMANDWKILRWSLNSSYSILFRFYSIQN